MYELFFDIKPQTSQIRVTIRLATLLSRKGNHRSSYNRLVLVAAGDYLILGIAASGNGTGVLDFPILIAGCILDDLATVQLVNGGQGYGQIGHDVIVGYVIGVIVPAAVPVGIDCAVAGYNLLLVDLVAVLIYEGNGVFHVVASGVYNICRCNSAFCIRNAGRIIPTKVSLATGTKTVDFSSFNGVRI